MEPEPPKTLTTKQVAARCGVTRQAVCVWIRKGIRCGSEVVRLVPDEVAGDRWRVTPAALEAFLAACRRAKLGEDAPPPAASPAKERRRAMEGKRRVAEILG